MAVSVTCPGCAATANVSEGLVGQKIRCKRCQEMFVAMGVPVTAGAKGADERIQTRAPAGAKPRTNGQARPMAKPVVKAKAPPKSSLGAMLAVGAAFAFVVGGVVVAWATMPDSNKAKQAANPTPNQNHAPVVAKGKESSPIKVTPDIAQPIETVENTKPTETVKAAEPAKADATKAAKSKFGQAKFSQAPITLPFEIPRDIVERVKRSAVFVSTDSGSGSGWFAEPGIVITNAHVVGMKDPTAPPPKMLKITQNQGLPDQRTFPGKLLGLDRHNDLAIIQVEGENLPDPVPIAASVDLFEGQKIYAIGFPYGHQKSFGRVSGDENIVTTVKSRQTIVSGRVPTEYGSIRYVQIEGGTDPGNSGSMIVDTAGMVRLIHVAGKPGGLGGNYALKFSIPSEYAIYLLQGRILSVVPSQTYESNGKTIQPLTAYVADPMKRIKRVNLDLWTGHPSKKIRAGGTTSPSPEPGDSPRVSVELNYDPNTIVPIGEPIEAKGECDLPALKDGQVYWMQPHYETPDGEERWGEAIALQMGGAPVQRKSARLAFTPKVGDERRVQLTSEIAYDVGQGGSTSKAEGSGVKVKLTETTMAVQPDGSAKMKFKYNDVSYLDEETQEQIKSMARGRLEAARGMTAEATISKTGEIRSPTLNLKSVPVPIRRWIERFNVQTLQSYEALSLALPGKEMNPGDSWKHQLNYALVIEGDYVENSLFNLTYRYAGTRKREGRDEAVIEFEGTIVRGPQAPAAPREEKPGKGGDKKDEVKFRPRGMTGQCRGAALIDMATGIVSLARTEAYMHFEVEEAEQSLSVGADMRIDLRREVTPGMASGDPYRLLPNIALRLNPFVGSPDHKLVSTHFDRSIAGLFDKLQGNSVRKDQVGHAVNMTVAP